MVSPPQQADNSDNLSDAREMDKLQKWNLSQLDCTVSELRITLRDPSHTCHRETALRACDLIAWLLQPAPADRPKSFDDVLAHSFFAGRAGTWRMSNVHVSLAIDKTIDGLEDHHVQESCRKGEHPLGKSLLHIAALEMEPELVRLLIDKLPIMFVTQADPATTTVPPTSFVNSRGLSFGASHPSHRSQKIGAGEGQLDLLDDSGNSPLHALLNLHINDWDASKCVEVCKLLADVTDLDLKNSVGKTVIEIGCNSECSAINSHFNARRNQRYAQRREDLFRRVVASDDDEIIEPWGLGANSYHDSEKELVPSFHEWLSKLTRKQTAQEEADETAQLADLQLETCADEAKKTSFRKRAETAQFRRKVLKRAVSLFKGCTGLHFLATYVRISSDKLPATFVQFKEEGPLAKPSSFEERKVPGYTWKKVMSDIVRFLGGTANVAYYKALLESCDRRTLLTDYRFEEVLGAGGFGQVSLCSNRHSARQSAIKIVMPNGGENSDAFRAAQSETEFQQRGSTCEYITKIFAWGVAGSTLLWVSMEHCDLGELRKYIAKDKGLVCPKTGVVNLRLRNRCVQLV